MRSDLGFSIVTIEGDSLSVIKKCSSHFPDKYEISAYIQNIKGFFTIFSYDKLHAYTKRSGNKIMHELAEEWLKTGVEVFLVGATPSFIQRMAKKDRLWDSN